MATNPSYKKQTKGSKASGNKQSGHTPKATGKTSCPGGYSTNGK